MQYYFAKVVLCWAIYFSELSVLLKALQRKGFVIVYFLLDFDFF